MFDKFRLKDVLAHYKQNFVSTQWGNEKYKWEAVKWFQDNWDVNAQSFPEMLSRSLDKTFNLLASINNFPRRMIVSFSKAAPEEVRAMFIALFDENKDVYERMNAFKLQASILLERYGNGAAQHYQYENAISTYLWLRYKPVEDSFELKYGIFYRFCQKAANQPDKEFFFIIDEINRGNMSKIFGELLMLIERDYRGIKATLAYNGLPFSVPKNLYIIGMMNTADRSLAMIDYALRRRFSFFEIEPGFDSEGFIHYQNGLNNETLNELVSKVKELNREIAADKSLGKGFCIGHSYFCGKDVCTDEWLHSIVDYDILPMLSEYWFDDTSKLRRWENILQGMFQ